MPEHVNNVISLSMDANFFFERAIQSLEKNHYEKALKYFRLAVEKEPNNPVNYCNLAGVLSEMGRFEESNEVLRHVTEKVAPDLAECYFYMANNAANMERFEEAEQYILRYLQADPEGEFAEEADEMLHMLAVELGRRPLTVEDVPYAEWQEELDRAQMLLENGQFSAARRLLSELVHQYPDCLPARNHLALAYYYCGQIDQALETVYELLEEHPGDFHALCNLAVFFFRLGETEKLGHLLAGLKKCFPLQREHVLKLGTTLGTLGEHEAAYNTFQRLLRWEPGADAALLHHAATAAFNTGRLDEAERLWKQAERIDGESGVPTFYLNQLSEWRENPPVIGYHYRLPFGEQFRQLEREPSLIPDQLRHDPVIRAAFFWALVHGDRETKLQVIQAIGYIGDEDAERALRDFLLRKDEDDDLKRVALFVLRQMKAKGPFTVWLNRRKLSVNTADLREELPVWRRPWQLVLDKVLTSMKGDYDIIQQYDVQSLWFEFLRKSYPNVPSIRKVEGWAAALEYFVAKMYGMAVTQHEIARKYGVSPGTIGRHVREIETVCGVIRRMNEGVWLPFFRTDEKD
jgi:tetratricopeptide (TPR) repeat protein